MIGVVDRPGGADVSITGSHHFLLAKLHELGAYFLEDEQDSTDGKPGSGEKLARRSGPVHVCLLGSLIGVALAVY